MDNKAKALLIKEFSKQATAMVDVEHLARTIAEGMDTDIKTGDTLISTRYYDAGVFVVDPLYKVRERQETTRDADGTKRTRYWEENGEQIANPYTETVRDNDADSRCASLSVKCAKGMAGAREEKRVKVKKLNLMGWNDEANSYPRMSGNIIFRQMTMSFADTYRHTREFYATHIASRPLWMSDEQYQGMVRSAGVLDRLAEIPPFVCFYDEKYGFLVKRAIRMSRIVYVPVVAPTLHEGRAMGERAVEHKVAEFVAHVDRREALAVADGRAGFKELVVMEAMKPERVEAVLEKHGFDGVDQTYDAVAVGVGKSEEEKAKEKKPRKVVKVLLARDV